MEASAWISAIAAVLSVGAAAVSIGYAIHSVPKPLWVLEDQRWKTLGGQATVAVKLVNRGNGMAYDANWSWRTVGAKYDLAHKGNGDLPTGARFRVSVPIESPAIVTVSWRQAPRMKKIRTKQFTFDVKDRPAVDDWGVVISDSPIG